MKRAALLVIFAFPMVLAAACGEPADEFAANGGTSGTATSTGGVSGTSAAGSSTGGTTPGAGNGTGGALGGANTGGVGVTGGFGGSAAGTSGASGSGADAGAAGIATGGAGGATGGVGPTGGTDTGGSGGAGVTGGTGGSGGSVPCTFTISHTQSTRIPTVEIVTFTTTLAGVTGAYIDFGITGQTTTMRAPVDLAEPMYRTVLLGMKAQRDYTFKITATSASGSCTSQETAIRTGSLPSGVPTITRTAMDANAQDRGFIITSGGVGSNAPVYIIDADGDIVWSVAAPNGTSRALMSYDGKSMWMMALNYPQASGEGRRVSMDGMTSDLTPSGFDRAHHDFTVLPDNGLAIIVYNGAGSSACSGIIERSASGTITNVVQDVGTIYRPSSQGCHPNSIHYYASSQTYTVSDRFVNLYVKIRRNGQLMWQFGGTQPIGSSFSGVTAWQVNHGHSMLADGTFLFFNNGSSGASTALSYMLNETSMVATKNTWQYRPGVSSGTLGDVQRLPNGNTLVTFSTPGNANPRPPAEIHEVNPSGALVQKITGPSFGYAEFRKSLYGPPLR